MPYSERYLRLVRDTVPLSLVIGEVSALWPFNGSGSGREKYSCCCPFHTEKTPSCVILDTQGFFYCFGCGERGDLFKFLMKYYSMNFPQAVRHAATVGGVYSELPRRSLRKKKRGST